MKDKLFQILTAAAASMVLVVTAALLVTLCRGSIDAFREFGFFGFIFSPDWDGVKFGARPFIIGTLLTSFLALAISLPFAGAVALFVGEYFRSTRLASIVGGAVDLLAGIPSIVYGLWGFYAIRPIVAQLGLSQQGFGVLTSSIVLAIMILPYTASLGAEFIRMVPGELHEAAYSLGATRAGVVRRVILPFTSSGLVSAAVLSLGRALGETMAVTMLIGNTQNVPRSLTDTGNTMASLIANQFGEAAGIKLSALIAIGLILFLITALVNLVGRLIIRRAQS